MEPLIIFTAVSQTVWMDEERWGLLILIDKMKGKTHVILYRYGIGMKKCQPLSLLIEDNIVASANVQNIIAHRDTISKTKHKANQCLEQICIYFIVELFSD